MERLLSILNGYRKRKIETEEEQEALVNVCDTISSVLLVQENIRKFIQIQGYDLLINLLLKQEHLRKSIVKIFDYSLNIQDLEQAKKSCKYFIEVGGLKAVFGLLMKKDKDQSK